MHSLWNTQVIKCYALSMFAGCEDHVSDFVVRTAQVTVSVLRRFHCVLNHPRPWLTGVTCIRSTDFLHDWTDPTKFEFAISRSITCLSQHAAGSKHGALRPQKPLRPIRAGEVGGWEFISNTYSLHCHHQNDSALRWAVVWAILMFHWLCGQSHKTVSINHNFWREDIGEPKRINPRFLCLPA